MEYLNEIVAFLVGLGTGWAVTIVVNKIQIRNARNTKATQNNNTVLGDMSAGDMIKNNRQ